MADDSVEALKNRISFLENIIESLPAGVLALDKSGKILLTNSAQEKLSNLKREEVVGQVFHEKWKEVLVRSDLQDGYWPLLNGGKPYEIVFHDVKPQFHDIKISGISRGAPLADEQGFIMINLTSQQIKEGHYAVARLAQRLAVAKKSLQNLINSSPNAIFTVAPDGRIRSVNKTAAEMFNYPLGDLLWKPVGILFEEVVDLSDLVQKKGFATGFERRCKRSDGGLFAARIQYVRMHGDDDDKLLVITDLSHEKDLEERVVISEKLAVYSELFAGIFHQLNNPLVGVVNFSALLLEKVEYDSDLRPLVETVHEATKQCQDLITTLMKGLQEPQSTFGPISIEEILRYELEQCRADEAVASARVQVESRIAEPLPEIMGDQLQLGQVFRNLINNGIQAVAKEGTIEVVARPAVNEHAVQVDFIDSGCGIPQENLGKIFTPFFTTKQNSVGGLGLSFCYQVIKNHGGRIEVESSAGQGARFRLVLPCPEPTKNGDD